MEASKPETIKRQNLSFLTSIIKADGPLSQRELAILSGLSVVTINKLVPELVASGIINESADSIVTGGRRAVSYHFNEAHQLALVLQLVEKNGQIIIVFYLCDLYGKILIQKNFSGNSLSWIKLKEIIQQFISDHPKISSISIGLPGVELDGIIKNIVYPPFMHLDLRKQITNEFDLPITIENDINAAVLGYYLNHPERKNSVVGLYYPSDFPPGAGIILNGQIIKGHNGFAGEIKYLPLTAQWNTVPRINNDIPQNILEVVQTVISMYDPDEIVIYSKNNDINEEDLLVIKHSMATTFPMIQLPIFTMSSNFEDDYLQGLISQGINLIEKENK